MSSPFWLQLQNQLEKRKAQGWERQLRLRHMGIDFYTNDYLGLAQNKPLTQKILQAAIDSNIALGSTGSRLISGHYAEIEELEFELAQFFEAESALLYGSGYHANAGVLQAIAGRHHTIIIDELAHASLKEGARLSLAKKITFRHNNYEHLESKLSKTNKGSAIIVTEGLFSMEGDIPDLAALTYLKEKYEAALILDEAHSTGVLGPCGKGLAIDSKLAEKVDIRIHTFGKAWGHTGAVVVGRSLLKRILINHSMPFIYTTAPAPINTFILRQLIKHFNSSDAEQVALHNVIHQWLTILNIKSSASFSANHRSPIQYYVPPATQHLHKIEGELLNHGFMIKAIYPPTVPIGQERLRINLHAYNTVQQIAMLQNLIEAIQP